MLKVEGPESDSGQYFRFCRLIATEAQWIAILLNSRTEARTTIRCGRDGPDGPQPELKRYIKKCEKSMYKLSLIAILLFPVLGYTFERNGWPGEGVPVISFKSDSYLFCSFPKLDKSCQMKAVTKGIKMSFDSNYIKNSKYITKKPVVMIAKEDFDFREGKIKVKKGEEFVNYQYYTEGHYMVGFRGVVYEAPLFEYEKFLTNARQNPETELWINVANKGWLKITDDNVDYHDRMF